MQVFKKNKGRRQGFVATQLHPRSVKQEVTSLFRQLAEGSLGTSPNTHRHTWREMNHKR